ncbi:MAG: hypothetical protein GXY44_07115 [Phycisphaerales bacterium]|nr:hypothetical protein [Phycisphaerales bacterium]
MQLLAERRLDWVVLLTTVLLVVLVRVSLRLYGRFPVYAEGVIDRDFFVFWVLIVIFFVDAMLRETSVFQFTNALFSCCAGVIVALDYLLRPQPIRLQAPFLVGGTSIRYGRMRPVVMETAL